MDMLRSISSMMICYVALQSSTSTSCSFLPLLFFSCLLRSSMVVVVVVVVVIVVVKEGEMVVVGGGEETSSSGSGRKKQYSANHFRFSSSRRPAIGSRRAVCSDGKL